MADSQSQPPEPPTWCYRKLTNIDHEGIRLKPRPDINSHGDGYLFHNDQYVSHIFPTKPIDGYVHVFAAVPGIRAQGYIHINYLGIVSVHPPLNGGLRRRKFRSHKKRHIKSRPRSNKSRSKKSCSRRR